VATKVGPIILTKSLLMMVGGKRICINS